jgi:hypothetical protein
MYDLLFTKKFKVEYIQLPNETEELLLRISPSDPDHISATTAAAFLSRLQVASQLASTQGTFSNAAPEFEILLSPLPLCFP